MKRSAINACLVATVFVAGTAVAQSAQVAQSAVPPTALAKPVPVAPMGRPSDPATALKLSAMQVANNPTVPAIESDHAPVAPSMAPSALPPPPVNFISGKQPRLSARERQSVKMAHAWMDAQFHPGMGDGGRVLFRFGATMPTVVCAPLYVCDIELQAGEVVNNINVGDGVRWIITPATSGSANTLTTHVIIKATDSDLTTDLIIATNRRTYVIKLVSRRDDWMPFISFSYPEDDQAQWAVLRAQQEKEKTANVLPGTGGLDVSRLQFNYDISGDSPDWKPVRIYTDGVKTYIQFPKSMQFSDAPALVALGTKDGVFSGPSKELVNYRVVGDRYVVDKVLDRAALISGVGHGQVEVKIARDGGK